MNKGLKNASGIITVMVSLLLIPLLSFGTLIMEAGRYSSAKQLLADAQITASMSILANYNTYLYERFGILAIDPDTSKDQTKATFVNNLKYNSDNVDNISSSSKLYNLNSDITFETIYNLSDYAVLKRQVLEYSKYSVPYEIISNNLDPESLFESIAKKLTGNAVFDFIEKIALSSEESVNVMDLAFISLGRYEYRTLDLLNYLSEDSKKEYSKDDYTDDLYSEYIKKDEEGGKGKLGKYSESDRYVSGRKAYIDAITEKENYMSSHPDPGNSLNYAKNNISASSTSVNYNNLYKAAIKKFLEDEANKPTDDNALGALIDIGTKKTTVSLTVDKGYSYSYDLSKGTAKVYQQSGTETKYIQITTAVQKISGDSDLTVPHYKDLESFAEHYSITQSSSYYLGQYKSDLNKNAKSVAKNELINELTQKKNDYDEEIGRLNGKINTGKTEYLGKLGTAKDKFNELIKTIEDDTKKVRALVANENGDMVEGTTSTKYNEGAIGRLKYAQETYKQTAELEAENAEDLGSNSQKVNESVGKVIKFLGERKTAAQNAVALIDKLITNVSGTQASSIKSHWNNNGADYVTGNIHVGSTCGVLAGYVSSNFSSIEEFVTTPVVDAEGSGDFSMDSLAGTLGISDIWNSIKRIKDVMNFVPATYDPNYVVKLNDSDVSILPNMTNADDTGGAAYNSADEEYQKKMLEEVQKTLGDVFGNTVFSEETAEPDTETFTNNTSSLFGSGGEDGSTDDSTISDLSNEADSNKSTGLLKLVTKIKDIIKTIKEAFQALKNLFGEIKKLFSNFIEQSMHALLINTYIIQKFPNRMNPVNGATTYPTESTSGSYFSSCCVEYCMFGNSSEKKNQSTAFWLIFGIKAVINCIQILTDPDTMSLISSCNIFAPLMFIAMLYMETNIDMNYLLRLGQEVPIWKDHLNLSIEGLTEIADDLLKLDPNASGNDVTVRVCTSGAGKRYHKLDENSCFTLVSSSDRVVKTTTKALKAAVSEGYTACQVCKPVEMKEAKEDKSKGIIPLDYTEYLYILMLFKSTNTKLGNLANLIQLETRYYESEQGIKSSFRIDKASTYVRSKAIASYNTMLPMFSLGSSGGFAEIGGLEYVGY